MGLDRLAGRLGFNTSGSASGAGAPSGGRWRDAAQIALRFAGDPFIERDLREARRSLPSARTRGQVQPKIGAGYGSNMRLIATMVNPCSRA
jgi:hypothetical protein